MPRRRNAERPGARLARSYLVMRADQATDRQPREAGPRLRGTVRLPQLGTVQLSSPEAHAQYKMAAAMDPRPEYQEALGEVRARMAFGD